MILVDSNVPMCLVGADDALRDAAQDAVREAHAEGWAMVTDAEVYQEVLHRYTAIGRRPAIEPCMRVLDRLTVRVYGIDRDIVGQAAALLDDAEGLSARDAIHVAVARHHGVGRVLSFDRAFDTVEGLVRLPALQPEAGDER